jgi:RNA polymerase sigma-70 factor (ECF subfamily)
MMVVGLDVETLYRKYGHSVLRRARQILASEDEAAEVLQELFTGLLAQPHQFHGRSAPSTFLYAATTHACLSRLRDQRNRRRLLDEQVRPWSTDVDPRPVEAASEVREVLALLREDEARAAVYHHLDGMSHAEVAEVLGCSRRHVGDLLERVTDRLVERKEASWSITYPIYSGIACSPTSYPQEPARPRSRTPAAAPRARRGCAS